MDKSAIRNFSIEARKILMKSAETEAGFYGVTRKGCKSPIQKGNDFEVYETLAGTENRIYGADIKKRANLVEAVETLGFDQVIEETAYTWFNRIIAIRFMEVNGYLPTRVRVLSSETGSNTPDIVTQSLDVDLNMTPEELEKVQKAKDENRYDDAFRMLFVKQCNELNAILPGLFEKTDDYMELLLKLSYTSDGVVRMLVDTVAEDNFNVETEGQVEIIGWMYQYYNTELKDDTFAKLKKNVKITKERIPAATQLFTPDWIVRYMVENSVGRVWIEHLRAMDSSIDEKAKAEEFGWKYFLPEAEQETEVQEKLVEIRKSSLSLEPKDIICIDPCMGSGHILVYMFDVLMDVYKSEGFSERDAAFSILENNIRGLDIDRRAYQLSYFALMMKARGYNRTFFRGVQDKNGERSFVEPVLFNIEESNSINREQLKYFGVDLNDIDKKNALNQMISLLDSFTDAKEYGAILNIDNYDMDLLVRFVSRSQTIGQLSFITYDIDNTQKKLLHIIETASIMTIKYLAVVTNPPYMGNNNMNGKLLDFVRREYPDTKSDMSTIFMERANDMCAETGYFSMINIPVWMFLASYEKLRSYLIDNSTFTNMLHFGRGVFGSDFGTTAFVIRKQFINGFIGTYMRLFEKQGAVDSVEVKRQWFFDRKGYFFAKQLDYLKIPGMPIAYWVSDSILAAFSKNVFINDIAEPRVGMATANNDRFIRLWFEVDKNRIGLNYSDRESAKKSRRKWFPFAKGGDCRKWYGNNDYVVNWENDGYEIQNFRDEETGRIRSHNYNLDYIFQSAITWTVISSATTSFRFCPTGFLYSNSGYGMFFNDEEKKITTLGFLNTKVVMNILSILSPTIGFESGYLRKIPYMESDISVEEIVIENINISKQDWDSFETSWDFNIHPLVESALFTSTSEADDVRKIEWNYNLWKQKCEERFVSLKSNEEEINRRYIQKYALEDELDYEIEDKDVTIRRANVQRDIKSLISYAVGCMFGRYSLDTEGIIYAGGVWDESRYHKYVPDSDGIIPITDTDYLKDDIVSRFEKFISIVYGDDTLEKNLQFIAESLGNKGESSREIIRNYFINDYFKDHCNTYSVTGSGKRPIYWLFDSGKQNGFKCLIYMHRYTKDTLNLIRSEYLHKTEDAVENALKNAEYVIQTSSSAVEKAKATKDRDKYVKQLNEMRTYYQALSHLAIQKIEIDLDDGVKHNYQLFQGVEVIVDGGKRQKVDLLAKI